MQKATFAELKSGSERFIAVCVSRSKLLPELYIGSSRHETGEIRQTAANGASVHTIYMWHDAWSAVNVDLEELTSRDLAGGGLWWVVRRRFEHAVVVQQWPLVDLPVPNCNSLAGSEWMPIRDWQWPQPREWITPSSVVGCDRSDAGHLADVRFHRQFVVKNNA